MQASPFEAESEITRYYEMLPEGPLASEYREMLAAGDAKERARRQERLRVRATPGSIDVNIMAKGDRDIYRDGEKLPFQFSDASAALRGFAESGLASSIIFSAGMNPRLYGYAAEFPDFFPDPCGRLKKKIVLKVSDFHSAAVQGKFLAKRGLWVSEYRIESGLNCGGHAFATRGLLMGPILEEFRQKRGELVAQLHAVYAKALLARDREVGATPLAVRITAQGGIGTAEEDRLLRERYGVDGTGWGTPFLLVPEVTNVDDEHLRKLSAAGDERRLPQRQLALRLALLESANVGERGGAGGAASPRTSRAALARKASPGCSTPNSPRRRSARRRGNTRSSNWRRSRAWTSPKSGEALRQGVLAKSCICHDLAGTATRKNGIDPAATPAVCCGPNIVNFSRIATLEEMVGHIYGRLSLLSDADRPHMFLRELALYVDYFRNELAKQETGVGRQSAAAISASSRRICSAASIIIANSPAGWRERTKIAFASSLRPCSARCRGCSWPAPARRSVLRVVMARAAAVHGDCPDLRPARRRPKIGHGLSPSETRLAAPCAFGDVPSSPPLFASSALPADVSRTCFCLSP